MKWSEFNIRIVVRTDLVETGGKSMISLNCPFAVQCKITYNCSLLPYSNSLQFNILMEYPRSTHKSNAESVDEK